ncbi:MAG: glycosyltransferase [Chloroflexi bacterium]|nr:glycosyltransferase [Chloroflexota bacterium]
MPEAPVAAQLVRTFLTVPTETFIYTQVRHLERHRAVVVSRDLNHLDRFPGVEHLAFSQKAHGRPRRLADVLYSRLRVASPYERRFFGGALRAVRPAVIHGHYAVDTAYFAPVIRGTGRPVVVSCYGYDVSDFPRRYRGYGRRYLRPCWEAADRILAMSEDMRADLIRIGCPAEKIRVHYHGIDLRRFPYHRRDHNPERVRILFAGSLSAERKGVRDTLHAFAAVFREYPESELRIAGDGTFRGDYEQLARSLGIRERVSFAGFVPHHELWREYQAAHVFCHPSLTASDGDKEGIPGTIVEAMASGLPVVTTRHAGIPEMVVDQEHGLVVAERDRAGIADGLRRLVADPECRIRMGARAAERARERGDAVRQTRALEAIYDEVLANAGPGAGIA